jgi:copper chaperone CopZ
MKRSLCFAAVAVVLAAVGGACAQTSKADVTKQAVTIVIDEGKATVQEIIDAGKTGFGPGDQLVEEAPVTDSSGTSIGDSNTVFSITSGKAIESAHGLLDCSINLAGGKILFNGYLPIDKLSKDTPIAVPVIGGTGVYAGAGGVANMTKPDDKHTKVAFDLLIPKTSE